MFYMFNAPEVQVGNIRLLSRQRKWGIDEKEIEAAEKAVPNWPSGGRSMLVLVPYFADKANEDGTVMSGAERTFHELWACVKREHPRARRYEVFDKAPRLREGIVHKPGLRWEAIDFGPSRESRFWGRTERARDVPADKAPHAGILAAAVLHPILFREIDRLGYMRYVALPGYELRVPLFQESCTPHLHISDEKFELTFGVSDCCEKYQFVPRFIP